jgi:hypothetical protein
LRDLSLNLFLNNLDQLVSVAALFFMSLYLRFLLQIMGQNWIKTIAHTATLCFLPILTYIITSVISGNIALSLGMVGALSIVRFRNPVRSPLELSVYFGAITMGISTAVSLLWLILLIGSISLVSFGLYVINCFFNRILNKQFFITSFSEGNPLSTLNVVSKKEVEILDLDNNLSSKTYTNQEISYTLVSNSFVTLKNIESSLSSIKSIISIQLNR